MSSLDYVRRFPVGAEVVRDGAHFRVWAPIRTRVEVVIEGGPVAGLEPEPDGYFSGYVAGVFDGMRYRFRLDDGAALFPDPASRFQPDGPHGPSQVVDPHAFTWSDRDWRGTPAEGQVLYELHVGTFTPDGTWAAAAARLPELAALGVTALEVMPVADFPGRFGWGYDGTCLFAPTRLYAPDDFRRFVDAARQRPRGHSRRRLQPLARRQLHPRARAQFLSNRHTTEWGEPFNSTARTPARSASSSCQRGILDRRVPYRRPGSTRLTPSRTIRPNTS